MGQRHALTHVRRRGSHTPWARWCSQRPLHPTLLYHISLYSEEQILFSCLCPQSGRSYTLSEVVPAVVAELLRKQPSGHVLEGMAVLRLNGSTLQHKVCHIHVIAWLCVAWLVVSAPHASC